MSSGKSASAKRKKTPVAPKRKRGTINAVQDKEKQMSARREVICVVKDDVCTDNTKVQVLKEVPIKATLDTGCDYLLVQEEVCHEKGWIPKKMRRSEQPRLTNPNGSPLEVAGYLPMWVRLPEETKSRKVRGYVVPGLLNKMLIGLPALKKLRWIPKDWPADIANNESDIFSQRQ